MAGIPLGVPTDLNTASNSFTFYLSSGNSYNKLMANQSEISNNIKSPARKTRPPDHVGLLIASLVMMLVGWIGLFQLVTTSLPRIGGELWLFFVLLQIAVTGTVLPIVRYVNVRFTAFYAPVPPSGVIVRQSIWIGLFVVTCAWLQIPRMLSWPLGLFIALVFIVIEVFFRTRELAAERDFR